MHIADVDIGILGANGIVGAGITIAVGAALSSKLRKSSQVTICFLGDGATNTSRFHEGVNMAACLDLPVIYVIENNMYAESTHISHTCKLSNIADRASAYGITGVTVDGNDVLAVYETVSKAAARARGGNGATLVECKTYRWHGHFVGDMQTYKSQEEREEWLKKDPIPRFRKYLIDKGILAEHDAERIIQELQDEIDKSVRFAEESELPDPREVITDVTA